MLAGPRCYKTSLSVSLLSPTILLREASLTREEVIVGAFVACHGMEGVVDLERELQECGKLGERDAWRSFAVHPFKYFYFWGSFPELLPS
jgi:hypothetical protein